MISPQKRLLDPNPTVIYLIGLIPPVLAVLSVITISLVFHRDQISNYDWQCGLVHFPSLSRIINLPVERIFWQFCLLFHIPIRILLLFIGFALFKITINVSKTIRFLFWLSRCLYLLVGLVELFFLSGLSIIGEKENIHLHVIFFYAFGGCSIGHMIANIFCHAHSSFHFKPHGRISYYLKILFAGLSILFTPILIGSFVLYWKKCITLAYDIFALCEYCLVVLNICFHGCVFFDVRYRVWFRVQFPTDKSLSRLYNNRKDVNGNYTIPDKKR